MEPKATIPWVGKGMEPRMRLHQTTSLILPATFKLESSKSVAMCTSSTRATVAHTSCGTGRLVWRRRRCARLSDFPMVLQMPLHGLVPLRSIRPPKTVRRLKEINFGITSDVRIVSNVDDAARYDPAGIAIRNHIWPGATAADNRITAPCGNDDDGARFLCK